MHLFFSLIIFLLSLLFLKIYQRLSIKFNIIDIPGSLSIHSKETPTGAGIVFALIFFLSIFLNQIYFYDFIKFDNPKNYLVLLANGKLQKDFFYIHQFWENIIFTLSLEKYLQSIKTRKLFTTNSDKMLFPRNIFLFQIN